MTGSELRRRLCGDRQSFTLTTAEVKERLGPPAEVHILPRWCRRTGRDIVVLSYQTDDGEAQVLGSVGFLNGEETLFEGWVVLINTLASGKSVDIHGTPGAFQVQPGLFRDWEIFPNEDATDVENAAAENKKPQAHATRTRPLAEDRRTLFDE